MSAPTHGIIRSYSSETPASESMKDVHAGSVSSTSFRPRRTSTVKPAHWPVARWYASPMESIE